jgi:hypothetical protein
MKYISIHIYIQYILKGLQNIVVDFHGSECGTSKTPPRPYCTHTTNYISDFCSAKNIHKYMYNAYINK